MLGNRALQAGVTNVTAGVTLGYNITGSSPNTAPPDLLTVSAAAAATITLPQIAVPAYGGLGIGDSQNLRILNLAAQTLVLAAASVTVAVVETVSILKSVIVVTFYYVINYMKNLNH